MPQVKPRQSNASRTDRAIPESTKLRFYTYKMRIHPMIKYPLQQVGIGALCWICTIWSTRLHAQEPAPIVPKHLWVLTIGPTWSQVSNSDVYPSIRYGSYHAPYYDRMLQPYVGLELFGHVGDQWIYSIGLSYIERITNNLTEEKLRFRSTAIELHGGIKLSDGQANSLTLYLLKGWMDSLSVRSYLTIGAYAGPVLQVENLNRKGEHYPSIPWDVGIKLRIFQHYYKYHEEDVSLPISIELGASVSLLKVLNYRLWTVYWYFPKDGNTYNLPWILPMFRFSVDL